MLDKITVSGIIPATPEEIYDAWIDPEKHGAMTDSTVTSEGDGTVGSSYTASDEYIHATFTELEPGARIVQAWRSTEFPEDAGDSIVEVILAPAANGTKVTINHSEIPEGQGKEYKKGWKEFYLDPMKAYFEKIHSE
jgi:uncharacterized protein YndB with AHSA1/START domain